MSCSVRAAAAPRDSWYHDPVEGGGILFGDVCHFIDLVIHFAQSLPVEVSAFATPDPGHREESWAITLRFANGGLGVVHYVCGSEKGHIRETIDILGEGRSAQIIGFRRLILNGGPGGGTRRLQPDFGQKAMLEAMADQLSTRRAAEGTEFEVGYGWRIQTKFGSTIVWHGGATGGYRCYIGFDPKARVGVIVLSNVLMPLVDDIGPHLLNPKYPLSKGSPFDGK